MYDKFLYGIQAEEKGSNAFITGIIISASPLCLTICSPLFGYFVRTLYGPRAYSTCLLLFFQLPKLGLKFTLVSGMFLVGGVFLLMG